MKNILLSLLATTSIFSISNFANAATANSNLQVSANVEKACYLKTLRDVHFNYQPEATSDLNLNLTSNSLFSYQCNRELGVLIHISGASNENRTLVGADNHTLNYKLTFSDDSGNDLVVRADDAILDAGNSSVIVAGNSFNFNFTIPKGQFVKPQNYSETITVSISY